MTLNFVQQVPFRVGEAIIAEIDQQRLIRRSEYNRYRSKISSAKA
jgi:hypothetical protein